MRSNFVLLRASWLLASNQRVVIMLSTATFVVCIFLSFVQNIIVQEQPLSILSSRVVVGSENLISSGYRNKPPLDPAPDFSLPARRTSMMNATTGSFSYVHISKCAGVSWITTLKEFPLDTCPKSRAGEEYSIWYQDNITCKNRTYHMVSLRSPRHHVWSQFAHCKYDPWGIGITKGTKFPRSGSGAKDDDIDFELWLDHFLPMGPKNIDRYNCYHPANYQSRALTSHLEIPRGVELLPNETDRFEPNISLAVQNYWKQDIVFMVEFFHESKCLFYYRLGLEMPMFAPKKAVSYVHDTCRCPKPANKVEKKDIHWRHHLDGHRVYLRYMPEEILSKVAELTAVDVKVYVSALTQFMAEIVWLESGSALNQRVMCGDVLKKLEPELEYLGINVTQLYLNAVEWFNESPLKL